ncbi:MAG: hypothetical protein R3336_00915, partial [Phycisphaeraceae bacterium]|nr:hypothetical protein [Phycisphaeraceae bacterium]
MQQLVEQLGRVRSVGRWMLLTRRVGQFVASVAVVALLAGCLDYLLRLPDLVRMVLGVAVLVVGLIWLTSRLGAAARFAPDLAALALRIERLVPRLRGRVAGVVDLAAHPDRYDHPERTALLARYAVEQGYADADEVPAGRLLDPGRLLRVGGIVLLTWALLVAVVATVPAHARLSAQRWLMPIGAPAWPNWTRLQSGALPDVWPDDTPLELTAEVRRGHHSGMRVTAHYRLEDDQGQPAGPWRSVLLTEQEAGWFDQLLDPATLSPGPGRSTFVCYFTAGDDRTDRQRTQLVPRPAVTAMNINIEPPAYARPWMDPLVSDLGPGGPEADSVTLVGLIGSTAQLEMTFNKPLPATSLTQAQLLPGLSSGVSATVNVAEDRRSVTVKWRLMTDEATFITLGDRHGLTDASERMLRLDASEDRLPTVHLREPAADLTMLPTGEVELMAMAGDDIAVAESWLEIERPPVDDSGSDEPVTPIRLASVSQPAGQLRVTDTLNLATLEGLKPGDRILAFGVARDVFDLDGQTHPPVRSQPRRIRIIDEATFVARIRRELETVRQQALRTVRQQQQLRDAPKETAAAGQPGISRQVKAQRQMLENLAQRLQQNRLDAPALEQLLEQSQALTDQAAEASEQAGEQLNKAGEAEDDPAAQEGRRQQDQVVDQMTELAQMLDEGRDALAVKMQMEQLRQRLQELQDATAEMMPETVGKSLEDLTDEERQRLEELQQRQEELAEQAQELLEQMAETGRKMSEPGKSARQQAMGKALQEAAEMGQQQQMTGQMQQAAESTGENQLSSAGDQQQQAAQTLEEMMEHVDKADEQRREVLKRQLAQLIESVKRLIRTQQGLRERTVENADLRALVPGQIQLRANTLSVRQQAMSDPATAAAGDFIGQAATFEQKAVEPLEAGEVENAR